MIDPLPEDDDYTRIMRRYVNAMARRRNDATDLLCLAFIRETGCRPHEAEIVIERDSDGLTERIHIRKRSNR